MQYSQVRKLARQYADGMVPRDAYLARRRTLLGEIAAGKIKLRYSSLAGPAPVATSDRFRRPLIVAALALAAIASAAAALHLFTHPEPAVQVAAPKLQTLQPGPGVSLVKQFVKSDDWSDDSIIEFETQMMQLTPRQRAKLRGSIWFRRLSAKLAKQITEQQAMIPLDSSGKAAQRAQALKAFAARLQIDPDA